MTSLPDAQVRCQPSNPVPAVIFCRTGRGSSRRHTPARFPGRAAYPGRGGGLWLRMIFPAGLLTWLVPSGWAVSVQPSWCSTT
jgi:hypothetical protein